MNIVIVGCGKVGYTIAKHLSEEGNDITIIDNKRDSFDKIVESIDVMMVRGNALSGKTLNEVSIKTVDLIICVTNSDETNILCCLTAKKLGAKHTIARVRDPEYALELHRFRKDLGLDMIINPEQQAALEMSRLLRFPTTYDIETFVGGRVELVSFKVAPGDYLEGKQLSQLFDGKKAQVLIVTVERGGEAHITHGDTIFQGEDIVKVIGKPSELTVFFRMIGVNTIKVKNAMIIGGGKITYYIANYLMRHNIKIKIIEIDEEKCRQLSENLPNCLIINGDGTDDEILQSENIGGSDAIICTTDRDEENVVIAMYARQCGVSKAIIKINHINLGLVKNLGIGSVVCPKNITANQIIRYVQGLKNSLTRGTIMTMHKIIVSEKTNIEALEFNVSAPSKYLDIPLSRLRLKSGVLVACIVRNANIIIPSGVTEIRDGDEVIVITERKNIAKFDDILQNNPMFGGVV